MKKMVERVVRGREVESVLGIEEQKQRSRGQILRNLGALVVLATQYCGIRCMLEILVCRMGKSAL